jgi:hypothetical protein
MDELFGSGDMPRVEDISRAAMQAKDLDTEELEEVHHTSKV